MPLALQVTKLAKKSATCSLRAFLVSPPSFILASFSAHNPRFLAPPPLRVPPRAVRPCSALCARLRVPSHGWLRLRTGRSDAQWTVSQLRLRWMYRGARKQSTICLNRYSMKIPRLRGKRKGVEVCGPRKRSLLRYERGGYGLGASTSGAGCGHRLSSMGMYCIQPTW